MNKLPQELKDKFPSSHFNDDFIKGDIFFSLNLSVACVAIVTHGNPGALCLSFTKVKRKNN